MIVRKQKPCKEGNHLAYLFSHGYCRYHWALKNNKEQKVKNKPNQDKLDLWYQFIYKKFGGICQETGRKLEFNKRYCCHILPKKRSGTIHNYSYFANDPRNGILADWWVHAILDKGTALQRQELKIWGQISKIRKELLSEVGLEYDEYFWLSMIA